MNVLVIGGNRFVGRLLVDRLLARGWKVTVFNRGRRKTAYPEGVVHIIGDRRNYEEFRTALSPLQIDVVVDMVAYERDDVAAIVETFGGRIAQYVFISSGFVYAVTRDIVCPLTEDAFFVRPVRLEEIPEYKKGDYLYGLNKRACEEEILSRREKLFRTTILRPAYIIGETDHILTPSYVSRMLDDHPVVVPDGGMNAMTLAYSHDVTRAIEACIANSRVYGEALNLTQDQVVTVRELIVKIGTVLGMTKELVEIPTAFIMKQGVPAESFPCSNDFDLVIDGHKASELLGLRPTAFGVTLTRSVEAVSVSVLMAASQEYSRNRPHELKAIKEWRRVVAR